MIKTRVLWGWILFFGLGSLFGCEEDPGCLDVQATNYQVDAEDPCGDCCEYPELRVSLRHRWVREDTTLAFGNDTTLFFLNGYSLQFPTVQYYLTNIRLVRADGTEVMLDNELDVTIGSGTDTSTVTIPDNVVLVEAGSFRTYVPGSYRYEGSFTELRFEVGVTEPALRATPNAFPDNHPLAARTPAMYSAADGYTFSRIAVLTNPVDTLPRVIKTTESQTVQTVSLPIVFTLDRGFNTSISLAVNYRAWFSGVDWDSQSDAEIAGLIVGNQPSSFSVISITSSLN
jgi:hypothetical protein